MLSRKANLASGHKLALAARSCDAIEECAALVLSALGETEGLMSVRVCAFHEFNVALFFEIFDGGCGVRGFPGVAIERNIKGAGVERFGAFEFFIKGGK